MSKRHVYQIKLENKLYYIDTINIYINDLLKHIHLIELKLIHKILEKIFHKVIRKKIYRERL